MNEALYVYGVVKFGFDLDWREAGIEGKNVYTISEDGFSALVHDCEEKPYMSEDPNKIKELIIAHNKVLDRAINYFDGVIPLHFNTIIKKGENTAQDNLKKWLSDNKDRLESIWHKVEGKKEYGIRIYFEKDRLIQEVSDDKEVKELEESRQGKNTGLNYLLQVKVKSKIDEIAQNRINQFKQRFYGDVKRITEYIKVNISRIFIDEEKDLLLNLSILVNNQQVNKIKKILEQKCSNDFSFQLAGPFAPYSFVENDTTS